jgi:hypothetical protein
MADEQTPEQAPRTFRKKTILAIAGMLVVEAALIIGAMIFFGHDPEVARADSDVLDPILIEENKIVEVLVLDAKLPNAKSGVAYLYSTEVYVQVRNRHSESVKATIGQFYNEIKSELTAIWRTSEPHQFQEPKLENLTRKVHAMLNQRFDVDDETGDPIVTKVVIVMGTGFRVDR